MSFPKVGFWERLRRKLTRKDKDDVELKVHFYKDKDMVEWKITPKTELALKISYAMSKQVAHYLRQNLKEEEKKNNQKQKPADYIS